MSSIKHYLTISAVLFGLVALAHLARAIAQWPLVIGTWSVPMALSWIAAIVTASLSVWAFSLVRRTGHG